MKPAPFDYFAPKSLPEAYELLDRYGSEARVLAGGQSLVPMLALRLARPGILVDLNGISSLAGIREDAGSIRIGALTRQAAALTSASIRSRVPLLAYGLEHVGHPPTRSRGTLGGSLSHADPAAETPAVMLAYGARMVVASSKGERVIPASEFTTGTFETALEEGEILNEIIVDVPEAEGTALIELAPRRGDFAMVSAAARMELDQAGHCVSATVVVGAVAPVPLVCEGVAAVLRGRPVTAGLIREAVGQIDLERFEFDNPGVSLSYRRQIGPVLVRRALEQAFARAKELQP